MSPSLPVLIPGAEPFFFPGGPVGCLLIHGFTGAPQEVRELGQRLAGHGYTVFGPRLAHHGHHPGDMNRSCWHDWYLSALDGWHILQAQCDQVVVIGLSMGGATALLLASQLPVTAVVAMSTPILLPQDPRLSLANRLWWLIPYSDRLTPNWREQVIRSGRVAYPVWPVHALSELVTYLELVDENLPRINAPALLLHPLGDHTAPPFNLDYIHNRIGSSHKEKVWIERGDHVMTEDVDKEIVFAQVLAFVQAQTKAET